MCLYLIKNQYICNVIIIITIRLYIILKRHWCFVGWIIGTWEIRIVCQWQSQKWMLRVCYNCIPGCVARVNVPSRTLSGYMQYQRGQTHWLVTHKGNLRASINDEQKWKPTFLYFVGIPITIISFSRVSKR